MIFVIRGWVTSLKYLYLPRLRSHEVLASAINANDWK